MRQSGSVRVGAGLLGVWLMLAGAGWSQDAADVATDEARAQQDAGASGASGATGAAGSVGTAGAGQAGRGARGAAGATGSSGATGVTGASGAAGASGVNDPLAALKNGRLVIWLIKPESRVERKALNVDQFNAPEPGYHETTPSALGQTAGSYGHDAGSYGVSADSETISAPPSGQVTNAQGLHQTAAPGYNEETSSTLGQTSSSAGVTAGSYGQTAGSLGQTASSYGQTAGSYGQTAGSFGNSLNTIAKAGQNPPPIAPKSSEEEIQGAMDVTYPGLKIQFVELQGTSLRDGLRTAVANKNLPDLLIFDGFPSTWGGPRPEVRQLEAVTLGDSAPERESRSVDGKVVREVVMLRQAPHPKVARAFLLYLDGLDGWDSPER